jgi:hypothetical protein
MKMQLSAEELSYLRQLMQQERLKNAGSNPGIPPTGPGGLFNVPGLNPYVSTTFIPTEGLEDVLMAQGHVFTSIEEQPLFGILTGQTASSGTEATASCDENVRTPGYLKMCEQVFKFGQFTMKTNPIDLSQAGRITNRATPLDTQLINDPFNQELANQLAPQSQSDFMRSSVAKAITELANDFKRDYAHVFWDGNPSNTTGSTGYIEYKGMNQIINTGYTDVNTGVACPAADSLVKDLNYAIVQNNPTATLRMFVEVYRDRRLLASQLRVPAVNYAWVMRRQLFLALTEIWPCAYYTYRCYAGSPNGNAMVTVSGTEQAMMRDDMRANQYLLIDGERVPVIIDNAMAEVNHSNGNFSSDAYLVPLSAPGSGFADTQGKLTYIEYFNYRNSFGFQGELERLGIAMNGQFRTSPDGRYIVMLPAPTAFCVQVMMRTKKRIICRTPFLAARISNAQYNVYIHERDPLPSSSFYVNGGNTSYIQTSYPPSN